MTTKSLIFHPPRPRQFRNPIPNQLTPALSSMEVILKVTERCNIDCDYCYFFNSHNQDYLRHPPYISQDTIDSVAAFLRRSAAETGVERLQIDIHGGEPLMMKKDRFDRMCETFREELVGLPALEIAVQTNAMLVDDEWIEIFGRHDIGIGVSIDGPREIHNLHRVDHRNRGTYDETVAGLRRLQQAFDDGRLRGGVGVIVVIDPQQDARAIFKHLAGDLGLRSLHFSLPMYDRDDVPESINDHLSRYLCDLFDEWVSWEKTDVSIRHLQRLMALLVSGRKFQDAIDDDAGTRLAFTIASNGDIGAADDLRNSFGQLFNMGHNTRISTLADFLFDDRIQQHIDASKKPSRACSDCCWGRVCGGSDRLGTEAYRFSRDKGFDNASIYCESIQRVLTRMTDHCVARGVPFSHIATNLVQRTAT